MSDRIRLFRVTAMPADTNPCGGVFGAWLVTAFKELAA
jgi:acyl-CoA hydrolase